MSNLARFVLSNVTAMVAELIRAFLFLRCLGVFYWANSLSEAVLISIICWYKESAKHVVTVTVGGATV